MFAQGQADAVAGYETMMLIGALVVLVLFGKIVWGKSTIRRRPVQRTGALAIFVVLLLVLVMLAVALISSR
jgi:NADH:ubiquinone oxidoreductase subunit 6 (subunit J)